MSEPIPVIQVQHVSKAFGGVHALQDVHFEIFSGEVHALLGENGAGKSTLIKIMTGVHQPDAGEILLDGQPVRFGSTRAVPSISTGIIGTSGNSAASRPIPLRNGPIRPF